MVMVYSDGDDGERTYQWLEFRCVQGGEMLSRHVPMYILAMYCTYLPTLY